MTCYRSRDNWHSYVKKHMDRNELEEMTAHLTACPECREVVWGIQEMLSGLRKNQLILTPPPTLKIQVMAAIDKNKYQQTSTETHSLLSHFSELRNWGFSMIAAGILLFFLNLTSLTPRFEADQMTELHTELSQQIAIPLEKINQLTANTLRMLESLTSPKLK